MIKARHVPFYVSFFKFYSNFMIRKHFGEVIIEGNTVLDNSPALIISNHFSWWDGFFINYLNNKYFKRKMHIMMLEEQLQTRMFLNKAGAFSINKGSRKSIESIKYSSEIIRNSNNLLVVFPQGRIQSMYTCPIVFEKGWIKIIENVHSSLKIVFVAIFTDYFSNKKNGLYFYLKQLQYNPGMTVKDIECLYNEHYGNCLIKQRGKDT